MSSGLREDGTFTEPRLKSQSLLLSVVTIHDACPTFSEKIFNFTEVLEKLKIKYNIALIPFFNENQDLPSFPEFVAKLKSCKGCEIALHGLYHEDRNGRFDDFHTVTKRLAEEEIRAALQIVQEVGIRPTVFIPPAWKLNLASAKVLMKLGFTMAEIQEKYVLLTRTSFKKILLPKVLNWDSTGHPHKNIINIVRNRRRFKLLARKKPKVIRIALHPRDPHQALQEQEEIIVKLKDEGYIMPAYSELPSQLH
jgi:predicted deacetylase